MGALLPFFYHVGHLVSTKEGLGNFELEDQVPRVLGTNLDSFQL